MPQLMTCMMKLGKHNERYLRPGFRDQPLRQGTAQSSAFDASRRQLSQLPLLSGVLVKNRFTDSGCGGDSSSSE